MHNVQSHSLRFLEPLPIVHYSIAYDIRKYIIPIISAHSDLQKFVLLNIQRFV
jgi:hypothetical protein